MSRKFYAAAIQMDAAPAPTEDRLHRADALVTQAASQGAKLIVLPELFNTGYEYSDDLYLRVERMDGPTVSWMKRAAAQHHAHIAASLLVVDGDHVYNRAVLIAPDGRTWTYDKNYPWAFERAYYRDGRTITIAETELGHIGLMICWDYAHADLWERYAGRVSALLLMSCPPAITSRFEAIMPDGQTQSVATARHFLTDEADPFGDDLNTHARWLGVPVIHAAGAGRFESKLPRARLSLAGFALMGQPALLTHLRDADDITLTSDFYAASKIINARGETLTQPQTAGDTVIVSEVIVNDYPPMPEGTQPPFNIKRMAYWVSDALTPMLMNPLYRKGYRGRFGKRFAPLDAATKRWRWALAAAFFIGMQMGKREVTIDVEAGHDKTHP